MVSENQFNSSSNFINGIKESVCPITSSHTLELEDFVNVKFSGDYIFNCKKIGNSILYIQNQGDMSNSNMKRYYQLVENFILRTGIKTPFVEIYNMSDLYGNVPVSEFIYKKDYLIKNVKSNSQSFIIELI